MTNRSLLAALLATVVSGCAQIAVKPATDVAPQSAAAVVAKAEADKVEVKPEEDKEPDPRLPNQELKADVLYRFLVAEIAGQRGYRKLATQAYLELARKTRDPRIAKRATEVAIYAHDVEQASSAAQVWLETEPESSRPREALVSLLLNAQRLSEVRPHLQALIADRKGSPSRDFLQLPRLLDRQADKSAVYQLVRELAEPYADVPEAHYAVAYAAQQAARPLEALAAVERALALKPDWETAAVLRSSFIRKEQPEAALQYLADFVAKYPQAAEARLAYARVLVALKRYAEARGQFQIIEKAAPESAEVQLALALISFQVKDFASTEAYLTKTELLDYKDKDLIKLYRGQLAEEDKRVNDAIALYRQVGGDHQVSAQTRIATLLAKGGNLAEARRELQNLPGVKDDKAMLIQAEASILRDVKAYAEAFDLLSKALLAQPTNTDLLYDRAMVAEKLDRIDVLEKDLRRVIELKPNHAQALNALGYTLADRTTRYQEALELIERALKLEPNDPFIMDSVGWVQFRLGNYKAALSYLQKAYELRQDAEIGAHLGEALWADGQRPAASKIWSEGLAEHPDNEVLRETVRRLNPSQLPQ